MIAALLSYLVIALLINVALFIPAYFFKTDKLTDISYCLTFIVLSVCALIASNWSAYSQLLFVINVLWACRLAIFLWMRIMRLGRDKRFDDIRNNAIKFFGFWLLQGFSVWLIMLPSFLFWTTKKHQFSFLVVVGCVVWALGLAIESIGDYQKTKFYRTKNHAHSFIDTGLWRYSRHPNYFGEILLWVGVYLFAASAFTWWIAVIALLGPVYLTCLLRFVSGVPPLEKSADAQFGHLPTYWKYKNSTNCLVPWFPKA